MMLRNPARTARFATTLTMSFATAFALAACESKNVPADRIVYNVHEGPSPPLPVSTPASSAAAPVQRADEATVRAWWDAHRTVQGYVPPFDDSAAQMAAAHANCHGGCSGAGIGLGIGIGLGFGWGSGGCGDGWGIGLSIGLPLGIYFW